MLDDDDENQLQVSTMTSAGRNSNMFKKIKKSINKEHVKVLSFGCSRGDELKDILDVFNVHQLVGVEYNRELVKHCRVRFENEKQVTIFNSSEFKFDQFAAHFDIIICCNVLCNFKNGHEKPLPFSRFQNMILKFWNVLSTNGWLFINGANYLAADALNIEHEYEKHLLHGDSGPVPCYDKSGQEKIERGHAKMWALEKKKKKFDMSENSIKTKTESSSSSSSSRSNSIDNVIMNARSRHVTFGILCYRSSKNIGDYGQTLAQINILSRFYRPTWNVKSPAIKSALEWLSETKPRGPNVRQQNYDTEVDVIWIERDTTQSTTNPSHDGQSPVYVIANGWYMHPNTNGEYEWPFASWIHPFLVSVHIARDIMLESGEAKEYLKKYGPVGCRDRDTEKLLRNMNIPCFFSGCLTYTLESSCLSSSSHFDRKVNYKNDILREFVHPEDVSFSHTMPAMLDQSYDDHLIQAMRIYKDYAKARTIQSTRIHTLMPALSIGGENLWFSSPACSNDESWNGRSRFSGLTTFMGEPSTRNAFAHAVCERLTEMIDRLLVNGLRGQKLIDVWKGKHYASLVTYKQDEFDMSSINTRLPFRWGAFRKLHKGTITDINGGAYDANMNSNSNLYFDRKEHATIPETTYIVRNVPVHAFEKHMNIVLTFDNNFIQFVRPFLCNLSTANQNTLFRCFCFTRDVTAEKFLEIAESVIRITNVILFDIPMTNKFEKYQTNLKHVSVSCMDRIFIPLVNYPVDDIVRRVIYLDLDVLIYNDISCLNDMCTGRKGIIAKHSKVKNVIKNWLKKIGTETVYHAAHSFNFGVAVFDIEKLQKLNFVKKCLELHYELNGANDQLIANCFCQGQYKALPGNFNVFVGQDDNEYTFAKGLSNTGIMYHYAGSKKPWLYESAEEYVHDNVLWELWNNSDKALKKLENVNGHFIAA